MRKFMEQPEVKAKMEELRTAQEQQRERDYAMVFKALDRRQGSLFRKMLGKKFDVQLAMAGMFRGERDDSDAKVPHEIVKSINGEFVAARVNLHGGLEPGD